MRRPFDRKQNAASETVLPKWKAEGTTDRPLRWLNLKNNVILTHYNL